MNKYHSLGKRLMSLVLCFVMVLGMIPVHPSAAAGELQFEKTGDQTVLLADGSFTNTAFGGSNYGQTRYSSDNTDVAEVNRYTGVVTLKDVGVAVISATRQNEIVSYTLTVLDEQSFAAVSPITGGNVNGSGTKTVSAVVTDAVLDWSDADAAVGRDQDGWWAGILVTAPNGLDAAALENVVYRSYDGTAWSADKRFWSDKASASAIQLWIPLTPQMLASGDVEYQYQFDWNNDGYFGQTITFTVSSGVVLQNGQQTSFAFADAAPDAQWVGQSYRNPAAGGVGEITYKLLDSNGQAVDETEIASIGTDGTVTFKTVGQVTVQATAAGDANYLAKSISYTVTAVKKAQEDFRFTQTQVQTTYQEDGTYTAEAVGSEEGTSVTYSIRNQSAETDKIAVIEDSSKPVVSIRGAGTVTIEASNSGSNLYEAEQASYTLEILQADQQPMSFVDAPTELIWSETLVPVPQVTGGSGKGEISYSVDDPNVAEVKRNEDGQWMLTLLKPERFTLTASKASDGNYKASKIEVSIQVKPAKQEAVTFDNAIVSVEYGDHANVHTFQPASGGSTEESFVYSVSADSTAKYALREDGSGVTILSAGSLIIQATRPGGGYYEDETGSYTLNISRADREIWFEETEIRLNYGENEYLQEVSEDMASGDVTYAMEHTEGVNASIDPSTGRLDLSRNHSLGSITVTATKAEDDCYNVCRASYVLLLELDEAPSDFAYSVTGTKENESGWYTGNVEIRADGYVLSDSQNKESFSDTLPYATEGQAGIEIFARPDNSNVIVGPIALSEIWLDPGSPVDLYIDYAIPEWVTIAEDLFGFSADVVEVKIGANDALSGIDWLEYSLDGGKTYNRVEFNGEKTVSHSFTISAQYCGQVLLQAADVAGNPLAVYKDGKTVVVDTVAPGVTATYSGINAGSDKVVHTNEDPFEITFEVSDDNYYLREQAPTVSVGVNGGDLEEQGMDWANGNNSGTAVLRLDEDGDYVIRLEFSDRLNTTIYDLQVHLDRIPAEIVMPENEDGARDYFKENQQIELEITEHNFDPAKVQVSVTATDNAEEIMDYTAYAKDPKNWTDEGDVHKLELDFDVDANYVLEVVCTDIAGNESAKTYAFTVDKGNPTDLKIEYEKAQWAVDLEELFGFTREAETVTISAADAVAGIEKLCYRLDGDPWTEISAEQLTEGEYRFTIKPEYRGKISLKAYDCAGNKAELAEERALVVDSLAPGIDYILGGNYTVDEEDGVIFTEDDDFSITFRVSDDNYDLRIGDPVVTVKTGSAEAVEQELKWEQKIGATALENAENAACYGEAVLRNFEEGKHIITITFEDRLEGTISKELEVRMDKTAPEIGGVVFDTEPVTTLDDGTMVFNGSRTASISITEDNFKRKLVSVSVTAVDANDKPVDVYVARNGLKYTYESYAKYVTEAWSTNGNVHTLTLPFAIDANYTLTLVYKPVVGDKIQSETYNFTIDATAPKTPIVTYREDALKTFLELLEGIGIGFFQDTVEVTVSASDATSGSESDGYAASGLKSISYSYQGTDGLYHTENISVSKTNEYDFRTGNGTFSFEIDPAFMGSLEVTATDWAGHSSMTQSILPDKDGEKALSQFVVDNTPPELDVEFTGTLSNTVNEDNETVEENAERLIYSSEVEVAMTITEANFYAEDVYVAIEHDGQERALETGWVQTEGLPEFVNTFVLSEDGDYKITVSYMDKSGNEMKFVSQIITVDKKPPTLEQGYNDEDGAPSNGTYYDGVRTAWFKITDRNFRPDEVEFVVTSTDINGDPVDFKPELEWERTERNPIVWRAEVVFDKDANYDVKLGYKDMAGNPMAEFTDHFTVDQRGPYGLAITYAKGGAGFWEKLFYGEKTTVTLSAEDATSGVDHFYVNVEAAGNIDANTLAWPEDLVLSNTGKVVSGEAGFIQNVTAVTEGGKTSLTFDVDPQFSGKFSFSVTDMAGNTSGEYYSDGTVVVVDNAAPNATVEISGPLKDQVKADSEDGITREHMETVDETTRMVYSDEVEIALKIEDANFDSKDVQIEITRDGEPYESNKNKLSSWVNSPAKNDQEKSYGSKTLYLVDDGDYIVTISYKDKSQNDMMWSSGEYDEKTGTYTYVSNIITVDTTAPVMGDVVYTDVDEEPEDDTFYSGIRIAEFSITDRNFRPGEVVLDVVALDVNGEPVGFNYDALTTWDAWTQSKNDPDTWIAQVKFDTDANYSVKMNYTDIAGNPMAEYSEQFTVDKGEPSNTSIEYSGSQFAFYLFYKEECTVTLKARDAVSGVHSFAVQIVQDGRSDATTLELPEKLIIYSDGTIDENSKPGFVQDVTATEDNGLVSVSFKIPAQYRGDISFEAADRAGNTKSGTDGVVAVIVDSQSPVAQVSIPAPQRIVDADTMTDLTAEAYEAADKEQGEYELYYNSPSVDVNISITEANFYAEDVVIQVNGNDKKPAGEWTVAEDEAGRSVWSNVLTLSGDGDYVITMEYKDRSGNSMESYSSEKIVIDTVVPEIDVRYGNHNVQNHLDDRDYFSEKQSAVLTIREHNFRPDDVAISVTATDVDGKTIKTMDYKALGVDRDEWEQVAEDIYSLDLSYDVDANYTFDVAYQDLATNEAADYEADRFTVDTTAPTDLTISYSSSVLEQALEAVSFGFYNAKVTVTITAVDRVSGIHQFDYSYINAAGVSSVNAQLLDQAIQDARITYEDGAYRATFEIPAQVLTSTNQFNGTVEFVAYDRSENETEKADNKRIVVDNISPNATVTYNDPVKQSGGVSYYADSVRGTIVIREANFYSTDVRVSVTRNGAGYPVNVAWSSSGDSHTGTFTLSEEGDYIVSVQYRDKSGNQMNSYTSNQLTVDTEIPVIRVAGVEPNSANTEKPYSFTISATDTNLDLSTLNPVLSAVIRDENGNYSTKVVELGTPRAVEGGYMYTVKDLPEDAVYTLVCSVQDMSGNFIDQLLLEDEQTYESVTFSINREGSAFGFGSEYTADVVGQYYVYSVEEDLILVEVNVDPVENYTVQLNGQPLTEGRDYTTTQSSDPGQWSKRTYIINKELFEAEGEYRIVVTSTDKTQTVAYSDAKDLSVAFVVDQTKPAITITGLKNGGRYQTDEQMVTLIPSDEGGRLNSLKIVVLDADGNPLLDESGADISVRFEMSGEELLQYLQDNDGKVTFSIPEGLNNQVRIICNDCAANAEGLTNEADEIFNQVTVSQSGWVIFYANAPLFYGCILGVLALLILFIILLKRRKDEEEEAKTGANA